MIRRPILRLLISLAKRRPLLRAIAGVGATAGTLWVSLKVLVLLALVYGAIALAVMLGLAIVLYREGYYDLSTIIALVLGKSLGWPLFLLEALVAIAIELLSKDSD